MSDLFKDVKAVLKKRESDYGKAEESFKTVAELWSRIIGFRICGADVAMCMAALKFCREQEKPKKDNVVDMIGYLQLYYDIMHSKPEATPPPAGEKV
jgi:hypothetical protein